MRGIAALSVVFAHISFFGNGAFGVDLFFLISGFIMMYITEKNDKNFLQTRAVRIIPLYWSGTLAFFSLRLLAVWVMPQNLRSPLPTATEMIKSFLFFPFDPVLAVGWTLVCEVFFYVVFFAAMKINRKRRHIITSGVLLVLFVLNLAVGENAPLFLSYYGQSCMLEFIFGMALYKILTRQKANPANTGLLSRTTKEYAMLIIAILIWAFMFTEKYIPLFNDADRLLKFGGPSVIFFVLIFKYFENRKAPHFLVILGNISYSLYITHWILVYSLSKVCDLTVFTPISAVFALAIVIPACIGAAWVSWYVVENKFTGFLRKRLVKVATNTIQD